MGRIARNVIIRLCEKRKLNPNDATLVQCGDAQLVLKTSDQQDENVKFTLLDEHDPRLDDFITERELANAISACIKNDKSYFLKNTQLRQLLFSLVEAKLKKTSIILSPQLVRFLAHKILTRNWTLLDKAKNFLLSNFLENIPQFSFMVYTNLIIGVLVGQLESVRAMIWYTFLSLNITSDIAESTLPM